MGSPSVARKVELSALLARNEASAEAQAARLDALRGKVCLWVTAPVIGMMSGVMTERVKWVLSQGVHVAGVFSSPQDKLYEIMSSKGLLSSALFVDMHSEAVADNIVAALPAWSAAQGGLVVSSVFSPYEHCQTIVGTVGTKLGLQSNSGEAYALARSKNRTREACAKAGLPTPGFGNVSSKAELRAACERIGFPVILKPSSGAGSAGVYRANSQAEADKAFAVIEEDLKKQGVLSWNPGCASSMCLVEELLVGPEFDIDILMWEGQPTYIRVVDNWDCMAPFFLETGSNMPSLFPAETVAALERYALDCVKACGFHFGCFHVECIVTKEGPRLIEVNARQGGGSMQEFNAAMHGVDIFANFFIGTFGIPVNPPVAPATFAMADYSITCPTTGVIQDVSFFDKIAQHPNVVRCTPFCKAGDKVTGLDTFPQWLGEFIVQAPTSEDCKRIVNEIIAANIVFDIKPESPEAPQAAEVDVTGLTLEIDRPDTSSLPQDKLASKDQIAAKPMELAAAAASAV